MNTLAKLGFNKEERFALIVLMFFALALVSPYVWSTFDQVRPTLASGEAEVPYVTTTGIYESPSPAYIIDDFFKNLNHYNYDEATSHLLDKNSADDFFAVFKNLYYIEAIEINKGVLVDGGTKHKVLLNTIEKEGKSNKYFDGLDYVSVTLKMDSNNIWKIHRISY